MTLNASNSSNLEELALKWLSFSKNFAPLQCHNKIAFQSKADIPPVGVYLVMLVRP